VRPRSITVTPVALFDYVSFCDLGANGVAVLRQDGSDVEMDIVGPGGLAATHVLRPAEVASMPILSRLVAREAAAAGASGESLQLFAIVDDAAGGESLLPPELAESGRDLLRASTERLNAADAF